MDDTPSSRGSPASQASRKKERRLPTWEDLETKKINAACAMDRTNTLRLDALNKFIVEKEKHTGGAKQEQAALSFARKSQPLVKPYPMYDELYNLPLRDPDRPREFPVSAVSCLLGYQPPKKALRHGMSKSLNSSMVSTGRSNMGGSLD
eukprot:g2067.t1